MTLDCVCRRLLLAAVVLVLALPVRAADSTAPITLEVDARQAPDKIFHAHMRVPVTAGPLTLFYPKWIPGEHGPTGPVIDVAGIKITASGKTLTWRRDLEEMFAIHCDVPAGATSLDVAFDFILPADATGFSSGASSTAELLVLSWNQVVMYPAGA